MSATSPRLAATAVAAAAAPAVAVQEEANAAAKVSTGETKTLFQRAASAAKKAGMFLSRAAKSAHRRILGTGEGRTMLGKGKNAFGRFVFGTRSARGRKFLGRAKNVAGHFLGRRTQMYNKNRKWSNFAKQLFSRKARNAYHESKKLNFNDMPLSSINTSIIEGKSGK